jgi:Cu/Ag efflux pump CusA
MNIGQRVMAISVISGLICSSVLSLVVIPVVYNDLDGLGQWAMRIDARLQKIKAPN